MNNEIKEIINYVNNYRYNKECKDLVVEDVLTIEEAYKLIDYITNLQERNEKAIEYIKQSIDNPQPLYNENSDELINDIREYIGKTNNDMTNIDTLDICHLLGKIDNLNNIITELEKWINEKDKYSTTLTPTIYIGEIQTKLKELKEGK